MWVKISLKEGEDVNAYRVTSDTVAVLGIYYGGQDYAADFSSEPDE
jgi:toxin ParE1/3/4